MILFKRKQWRIKVICGHCGYALRSVSTLGLSGCLMPIQYVVTSKITCIACGRNSNWWLEFKKDK